MSCDTYLRWPVIVCSHAWIYESIVHHRSLEWVVLVTPKPFLLVVNVPGCKLSAGASVSPYDVRVSPSPIRLVRYHGNLLLRHTPWSLVASGSFEGFSPIVDVERDVLCIAVPLAPRLAALIVRLLPKPAVLADNVAVLALSVAEVRDVGQVRSSVDS